VTTARELIDWRESATGRPTTPERSEPYDLDTQQRATSDAQGGNMRSCQIVLAALILLLLAQSVTAIQPGTDVFVSAAARATGRNNAQWIMDMYILNPGLAPANVTVYWLVRNRANTSPASCSYSIAAGETLVLDDVILSEFGLTRGLGAFRVTSDRAVVVNAVSVNVANNTEYGHSVEAIPAVNATKAGDTTHVVGLKNDDDFRTNITLIDVTGQGSTATVEVIDTAGAVIGSGTYVLRGFEPIHESITELNTLSFTDATLKISVQTGAVISGASRIHGNVNAGSGDPITLNPSGTTDGSYEFEISTPEEQGLDPLLLEGFLNDARGIDRIYSVLVLKNDKVVAEQYFNGYIKYNNNLIQSATKSYFSTLVGIALDKGCLTSLDQKMMDFFPEYASHIEDQRKFDITIRQLLQMRSGFPSEEEPEYSYIFESAGGLLSAIVEFPLIRAPGTGFAYTNISPHTLGVIVSRACNVELEEFIQDNLFSPLEVNMNFVFWDPFGNLYPVFSSTPRDLAKFGLLYLNQGVFNGKQIVSPEWVDESLQVYTEHISLINSGPNFSDMSYGYQWWFAKSGEHEYYFAAGQGGQMIVVLFDLDMLIVTTADPFQGNSSGSWETTSAIFNLVGDFITSLPAD
jgi:CubicO group peptidase (beta-lactamase class C family)